MSVPSITTCISIIRTSRHVEPRLRTILLQHTITVHRLRTTAHIYTTQRHNDTTTTSGQHPVGHDDHGHDVAARDPRSAIVVIAVIDVAVMVVACIALVVRVDCHC